MKKNLFLLIAISIVSVAIIIILILTAIAIIVPPESGNENNTFHCSEADSYFVDCKVENGRVKIRYSMCFVNNSDHDVSFTLAAKFKKNEVKRIMKSDFVFGCDENGDVLTQTLHCGEKKNIVYIFERDYLGGDISKTISFPEELALTYQYGE